MVTWNDNSVTITKCSMKQVHQACTARAPHKCKKFHFTFSGSLLLFSFFKWRWLALTDTWTSLTNLNSLFCLSMWWFKTWEAENTWSDDGPCFVCSLFLAAAWDLDPNCLCLCKIAALDPPTNKNRCLKFWMQQKLQQQPSSNHSLLGLFASLKPIFSRHNCKR